MDKREFESERRTLLILHKYKNLNIRIVKKHYDVNANEAHQYNILKLREYERCWGNATAFRLVVSEIKILNNKYCTTVVPRITRKRHAYNLILL